VYIHVYVYTHVYIYTHTYTYIRKHMYIHIFMPVSIYIYACVDGLVSVEVCVFVCAACMRVHTCISMCTSYLGMRCDCVGLGAAICECGCGCSCRHLSVSIVWVGRCRSVSVGWCVCVSVCVRVFAYHGCMQFVCGGADTHTCKHTRDTDPHAHSLTHTQLVSWI